MFLDGDRHDVINGGAGTDTLFLAGNATSGSGVAVDLTWGESLLEARCEVNADAHIDNIALDGKIFELFEHFCAPPFFIPSPDGRDTTPGFAFFKCKMRDRRSAYLV